jgi:hypothetical protein
MTKEELFAAITAAVDAGTVVCSDVVAHLCTLKDYGATPAEIAAAEAIHSSDECEIDDDIAMVSRADSGFWVSAWVWVEANMGDGDDEEV